MTLADALAHAPLAARPARRVRPRLPHVHLRHDRAVERGDALEPERRSGTPASWIDILQLTERDVAYSMFPLFHVTAPLGGRDLGDLGRRADRARDGFSPTRFWDDVRESEPRTSPTWAP